MPADVLFLSSHVRIRLGSATTHAHHPASPQQVLCLETCSSTEARLNMILRRKIFPKPHSGMCLILTVPGPGRLELSVFSRTFVLSQRNLALKAKLYRVFDKQLPLRPPGLKDTVHLPQQGYFQSVIHPGIALLASFPCHLQISSFSKNR